MGNTDAHEFNERVVDSGSMREEERASRAQIVKEEQLLLLEGNVSQCQR